MTAIIICRSGKTRRGFRLTAPKRHAAMAHLNTIWRRSGPQGSSAIYGANVAPMGPTVVVAIATENWTDTNLSAISIRCQFTVPPRAHTLFQSSARWLADLFHLPSSFRDASAYCLQCATGVTHEAGAMCQERGFFSQGEIYG